jgi:alanyl-tRNA synthetase
MDRFSINNIRKEFLEFYKSKGHLTEQSFSLIPKNDKSLLLIGAGMAPMKKYFTGDETPPLNRMATCQKCIRTGDIENVGITTRHLTFFEMLGNFSFGNYFKQEAIEWAWEFLTEVLKIEKEKLWVTVYEEDDKTLKIWNEKVGLPLNRIVKLGKKDNFWELEVGPSGPCSEIYYDTGNDEDCDCVECKPGCECSRYVEIWNLVFTQFDKNEQGNYNPLSNPNIDTGMGIERLATVLQGKKTVFDVEPLITIIRKIEEITGMKYGENLERDISMKIICDHSRAATFMIADGVLPSNEGRGYVLRRLIRRAIRQGKSLGIQNDFLRNTVQVVINEWKHAYRELSEKEDYILKVINLEEEKFKITIDQGLELLQVEIQKMKNDKQITLDGNIAFKLYDTYGFPAELTEEILLENNFKFDKKQFKDIMDEHRDMARQARNKTSSSGWKDDDFKLDTVKTIFTGYTDLSNEAMVLNIVLNGEETDSISEGETGVIILDQTPFYPEGGGQIGDTGKIVSDSVEIEVLNTKKYNSDTIIHEVKIISGTISKGEKVTATVDSNRRKNIAKNHTCTHILHKVLKNLLGEHVNQAGSHVTEDRLRFDYTHFESVDLQTIKQIEKSVNEVIENDYKVIFELLTLKEAKKSGATALFDEKYKDTVRIVKIGDFSKELCGGIHVDETAKIGMFKILSESSIASGVRRIEAVTGKAALNYLNELSDLVDEISTSLKTTKDELSNRVNNIKIELKEKEKEIQKLNNEIVKGDIDKILDEYEEINGIKLFAIKTKDKDANLLRDMADKIKEKNSSCVIFLSSELDGKVLFVSSVTKDLINKKIHAGNIVKQAAIIANGGGGGRPDFAQAGGKDKSKIDEAIKKVKEILMNIN